MQSLLNLFNQVPILALLSLSAASVVAGDYFAKSWSQNQKPIFLLLGLMGYLGSGFFYIPTLLRAGLVSTSVVWDLLSLVGFLFIGLVIFKESYTTIQLVGVGFGVFALIFLSIGGK